MAMRRCLSMRGSLYGLGMFAAKELLPVRHLTKSRYNTIFSLHC